MSEQTPATATRTRGGVRKNTTMDDGIRKPRGPKGKWGFVIDLKTQPAQRCRNPECPYLAANSRSAGFRHWTNGYRLDSCPHCGEGLLDTHERRLYASAVGIRRRARRWRHAT